VAKERAALRRAPDGAPPAPTAADPAPSAPRDARLLRAGLAVLRGQALALLVAAVWLVVHAAAGNRVTDRGLLALDVVAAAVGAAVLALFARSLGRGGAAARTPTLLAEFLCLPVGAGLVQGGRPAFAVLVLGPAVAVIVLLGRGLPPRERFSR
jgi:hypothetical protein